MQRRCSVTQFRFPPVDGAELKARNWDRLDVILVTGDAFIDSPQVGVAVIARVLEAAGYRVGVIAQPDVNSDTDILRLGEPRLFWGITAGCLDSMVANRTAQGKPRRSDDYTPGGRNERRPDRASLIYANLIRRHTKAGVPIVLGGLEASLRRVAHYDYWSDKVRRSLLVDARADFLLYGMAEGSVLELAASLRDACDTSTIRGLCTLSTELPADALELPSYEEVRVDKQAYLRAFRSWYENCDPVRGRRLAQRQDTRWLVQNPPPQVPEQAELDRIHELPFTREVHPRDAAQGEVRAIETIRHSLVSHRGCYGECNFCAVAAHEGRRVHFRSPASLLREARVLSKRKDFKGVIQDLSGPTANMYGYECALKVRKGACADKRCLFPAACSSLGVNHKPWIELLRQLRQLPGVKQVRVASGLRHDLLLADRDPATCLDELLLHHTGGRLRLAPEHCSHAVLQAMGKPGKELVERFHQLFRKRLSALRIKRGLVYYLMAAHPACTMDHARELRDWCKSELGLLPDEIQIYTPLPGTWSATMYHTGIDPATGSEIYVERSWAARQRQKDVMKPEGEAGRRKPGQGGSVTRSKNQRWPKGKGSRASNKHGS